MPCIYVYFFDGRPIYVGQTRQQFLARDQKHLTGGRTTFDRHYRHNKHRYTSKVVYERAHATRRMLDYCEISMIRRLNTYRAGLNGTPGGTMTKQMAYGFYKEKLRMWKCVFSECVS
jgi:hypothetical protein